MANAKNETIHGKVKWFDAQKGYGFITNENGEDIFVHFSGILSGKTYIGLDKEDKVSFEVTNNKKGPQAVNVTLITDSENESDEPPAKNIEKPNS